MTRRIEHHPVLGPSEYNKKVTFTFDGQIYTGMEGESVAAALLVNDVRTLRRHEGDNTPRGIYCNIGHCMECRVTIDGKDSVRACMTPLEHDMEISSGKQLSNPVRDWSADNV